MVLILLSDALVNERFMAVELDEVPLTFELLDILFNPFVGVVHIRSSEEPRLLVLSAGVLWVSSLCSDSGPG